jgi:NAD(P)-dependent dehydrogenase (short-subunit alcohol dehydrogenase family)
LVQELLPILKHTAALSNPDVRVVTVSSVAHPVIKNIVKKKSDLNVTFAANPSLIDSIRARQDRYHFTKLLNILFASKLQRRADKENVPIISISVHPGVVATPGGLNLFPSWLRPILRLVGLTPLQSAISTLFASTAPVIKHNEEEHKGSYLGPSRLIIINWKVFGYLLGKGIPSCSKEICRVF